MRRAISPAGSALRLAPWLLILAGVAGCAQFPELDSALTDRARQAPYPELLPVETLKARVDAPRISETAAEDMAARVAGLKARAAALRRTVIDGATRARMQDGVDEI